MHSAATIAGALRGAGALLMLGARALEACERLHLVQRPSPVGGLEVCGWSGWSGSACTLKPPPPRVGEL